jgi:hypothetical protein
MKVKLTSSQLETIRQEVDFSEISISTLQDDLLDHLICSVEDKLNDGNSFSYALNNSVLELAPKGFKQIEKETIDLLNHNSIPMKKLTYSIGLVTSMMMAVGLALSTLRWPGGGSFRDPGLISYGFISFVMLFLPLVVLTSLKSNPNLPAGDRTRLTIGLVNGLMAGVGVLLKIMHTTAANEFLVLSTALFIFGFLPSLFFTMYKKSIA